MSSTVDITRLNRTQRRDYQKKTGNKVFGRNLPYIKEIHGNISNYYTLREEEIKKDYVNTETKKGS